MKQDLKDISFDEGVKILNSNRVKGSILPKRVSDLDNDVVIERDAVIEGAVYGHKIEIKNGDAEITGAAFAQLELHIDANAKGTFFFHKAIGAVSSIISHAPNCRMVVLSDANAQEIRICNAYISGSVFGDEIDLENCVVIGGVFATKSLNLKNCVVGTFNAPSVSISGINNILMPSVFSYEPVSVDPTAEVYNLSLADLCAYYRGDEPAANSGRIKMNMASDEIKSSLTDDDSQISIRSYSVVGKVLATDMINWDNFQNHFLLSGAGLGNQLLHSFDAGTNKDGEKVQLDNEKLIAFFFDVLSGKLQINDLQGNFSIEDVKKAFD